jgi:hypothetical protein
VKVKARVLANTTGPDGVPRGGRSALVTTIRRAHHGTTMIEPRDALARLTDWGFVATSDLPDKPGPASLLVALRERPTLIHYDPERVEYWTTRGGRGAHVALTRETAMPFEGQYSWGLIKISDRLAVSNEYATFGGHVTADLVDGVVVLVFTSPAPILRRGGHSQGWDPGATSIAAFFGRLLVAVDFRPGFEAEVAAAEPLVRYAAFLQDVLPRYRASTAQREAEPEVWRLCSADARRLEGDRPDLWAAGAALLASSAGDRVVGRSA